jgi:CRISPR-associated protein Csm3
MEHKLLKKIIIRGNIKALTGIAIGGSNTAMGIGGIDKGVIRNPVTQQPYIPGSTLKGKMRSLLELRDNSIGEKSMGVVKNGPSEKEGVRAVKLFGNASGEKHQRPSRIIVRDAYIDEQQIENQFFKNTDLLFTEVKTEVVIDRITSKAMPRQLERIPSGAMFNFEMVLNVFQEDDEAHLTQDLFAAMQLVQNDYIGGSGSRGSGQICFQNITVKERSNKFYTFENEEEDKTESFKQYFPK